MADSDAALTRASSDDKLIEMWLHDRPAGTQTNYRATVRSFQRFLNFKPLQSITLEDLQAYQDSLSEQQLKDSTKRCKLNAIKSLFTFATKLQYTRFNVAAAVRVKKGRTTLAGRILNKSQVAKMLREESNPRNAALLKLMYATGARVSEVCGLTWEDFQERDDCSVQVRILGKGNKQRVVLVPEPVWDEVRRLKGDRSVGSPVFVGKQGKSLDRTTAHKILKAAAERVGLNSKVSCHWLRHAHAQHSLAGGAPLPLVRDSLGHSSIAVTNVYLESSPEDSSSKYLGF
ncbi:tyrosine-type recombinase/integrase [Leptolyngbya sp. FACHB-16]|uniref:tyrosine-type recombinase/integrase n=1 Tax=unclassified Leptolyngbya TaxID=2650499 RepID=UPI0016887115|nr:tyrosine-type recombinase/integrase [Leptolyngbya sp. FACHB-16]MBD2156213.1 tyrosine-type recombinase/integrase [Leptolyngbya sp. FACHB-16]